MTTDARIATPWEICENDDGNWNVERGDEDDMRTGLETGAENIGDYDVAVVVKAALNLRDRVVA